MTYGFGRSTYRSPRGRVSSFCGRGRGASSDSYHSSSSRESFSTKPSFRGSSFRNSGYRGLNDHRDSHGRGTHRYSGERDPYSISRSRRDEESSYHRHETRESSSGSYGREYSHSRRSDGESDRKRLRIDVAGSFKEGYSPRRSYDEHDHPNRSLNSSSSSPYRSHSSSFGGKSYKKDFNDFKEPLPPSDRPRYSSSRPTRGIRGRISITIRPTPMPSLSKRNPTSRFKPTSRLQLSLRKKKQIQIMRMRKERETRIHSSSSGKLYAKNNKRSSSIKEEPHVDGDVDREKSPNLDDGPPGVSSASARKTSIKKESGASPEKSGSQSESPKFRERTHSSFVGYRRIALKCPHCKMECKMFKSYQAHLLAPMHKAAMEKLLHNLKQKLRRLRTEQREAQRLIDERDDNFNRTSYCKLCKLNYKQTRREHMTSDFHVSLIEFLDSRCTICRMDFPTPLLYEHHRCTLTHIKRKAFLERKRALKVRTREEENNDDENFMVLDSVESADDSNEDFDSLKENTNSPKKTSLEAKKKTTIIGSEYIKKVNIYYCKLCKLCLHYNPNRDAEDDLLSHCRTRFHLKRFSLEDAKKSKSEEKILYGEGQSARKKSAGNASVEAMDSNDEENEQFSADDEVTADGYKSSENEDDSHSGIRFNRFRTSDENEFTDKIKVEPVDDNQPMIDTDILQNVVVKSEPK